MWNVVWVWDRAQSKSTDAVVWISAAWKEDLRLETTPATTLDDEHVAAVSLGDDALATIAVLTAAYDDELASWWLTNDPAWV